MVALRNPHFSKCEYVALENEAETKSEHINGEIYAMAGGSPNHSTLGVNATTILANQLRGKPCQPFNSDTRIEVLETEATFYPDVSVACPPLEYSADDPYALTNPVVLIEVLSASTEKFDRGEKWSHYQRIPSLRDFLLISQDQMRVEHYMRQGDRSWLLRVYEKVEDVVQLDSVECTLLLSEIYERVEFAVAEATQL
jgi:Uma2 family endonuclease